MAFISLTDRSFPIFPCHQCFPARVAKRIKIKVIPQKLNLPIVFFETFPESSLLRTVSKKTIKMIGHHSRLRDMMGQS